MQLLRLWSTFSLAPVLLAAGQKCYVGPNEEYRGKEDLVPCSTDGDSACCLRGDICLSGNACWDAQTGNTYQYGCTDSDYRSEVCPYKCGANSTISPWVGLGICNDVEGVTDTWMCFSSESCGCGWNSTWNLFKLPERGCKQMGDDAKVALYAPSTLAPYVSLPSSANGSTGYYKPTTISGSIVTWDSIALRGYTPATVSAFTSYPMPTKRVLANTGGNQSTLTRTNTTSHSSSSSRSSTPISVSNTLASTSSLVATATTSSTSSSSGLSLSTNYNDILTTTVSMCLSAVLLGMLLF